MYVTMLEICKRAMEGGYGVTAPNVYDDNSVYSCISAAEELNAPMIIDIGYGMAQGRFDAFVKMTIEACRNAKVPVCINLDHGGSFEHVMAAIRSGMTSVMADRSTLPFEENVAQVAEIVRIAHISNVTVEAELGHVGQGMQYEVDRDAGMTNPDEAKAFVDQTGVDCLAIAMGTAHGVYKGTPKLDFDLLAKIKKIIPDTPLVLHGGSGTGDENLARSTREGIAKVNIFTDLSLAGVAELREKGLPENTSILGATQTMQKGYKDKLIHYMKLFNMENKAW